MTYRGQWTNGYGFHQWAVHDIIISITCEVQAIINRSLRIWIQSINFICIDTPNFELNHIPKDQLVSKRPKDQLVFHHEPKDQLVFLHIPRDQLVFHHEPRLGGTWVFLRIPKERPTGFSSHS